MECPQHNLTLGVHSGCYGAFMESDRHLDFPSLADLQPRLRQDRMLRKLILLEEMPTKVAAQLADVYVHAVERVLRHYEAARQSLESMHANGGLSDYRDAQDAMEGAVSALHRAGCCLERLRRLGLRVEDGSPFVPRPRDLEVLSPAVLGRVRAFRDTVEHVDDDIASGRIDPSAVPLIHMGWTRATFLEQEIAYSELASWTRSHYYFAHQLSAFQVHVAAARDEAAAAGDA